MGEREWLVERFEQERARLRSVAYRMLGSHGEADDAVQEAWLRLSRSDAEEIDDLGAWLTTVVARVCLNVLRRRASRREESLDAQPRELADDRRDEADPEHEALLAESVGLALLVVLDSLSPAERVAFVLHDMFDLPFDAIAPVLGRTPAATRQLASRARRRVQGTEAPARDLARQQAIVDAFLAASRGGDLERLLALLDPEVVLRADSVAVAMGADAELRGADAVAGTFSGRARVALPALVNGAPGAVWASGGRPRVVFAFTIASGRITEIDLLADPERLGRLELTIADDGGAR